ncbi:hypothetical protein ScPMuIL_006918 [Solemya velum]
MLRLEKRSEDGGRFDSSFPVCFLVADPINAHIPSLKMFQMRQSKFRHVFGKPLRRDQCYDNIRITKSSWDSTYCSVNPKYLAIVTEAAGGGAFLVIPLSKTGRVERDTPLVAGHKAAVLDLAWCPHNDDIIASASEDCSVKIWQIPEGGLTKNMTEDESIVDLVAHQRRVTFVVWHPSANSVLLSAGSDNKVFIWNVGTGEPLVEIDLPDLPLCASFSYNGSRMCITSKDKKLRVLDPRTGEVISEGQCHDGAKPAQCVYIKGGYVFTTGFSRMSERQYALWDENNLSKPKVIDEIDNSNGVIFPFYDPDTNMIYLCGKGDSIIRYYEITDEAPFVHFLNLFQSKEAQRGIGSITKRAVNVNTCEIARYYKLHNSGLCEVIPFTVPRKSELFQDDLYPDTAGDIPAISADEWFSGKDADPILVSMRGEFIPTRKEAVKVVRKSNVLDQMPSKTQQQARISMVETRNHENTAQVTTAPAPAPTPAPAPAPVSAPVAAPAPVVAAAQTGPSLPPGFDPQALLDDVRKLKLIVKAHERRIKSLEDKVAQYEANTSDEEEEADHC